MNQANILVIEPEQEVPEKLVDLLLKEFDTCFGIAMASPEDKRLAVVSMPNALSKEELKNIFYADGRKALRKYAFMSKSTNAMLEEDIQPFVLFEGTDGKPAVSLFIEGDVIAKKRPAQSAHTDEFHVFYEVIRPLLLKEWDRQEHDVGLFMKEVSENAMFTAFIRHAWGSRGVVVILASDGNSIVYQDNELGTTEADWGWSSHHCGYELSSKEVLPESKSIVQSAADKLGAAFSSIASRKPPPTKPTTPTPPPPVPTGEVKQVGATAVHMPPPPPSKAESSTTAKESKYEHPRSDNEGYMWVAPPQNTSASQRKDWYKANNNGHLPQTWKQGTPIEVPIGRSINRGFRPLSADDLKSVKSSKVVVNKETQAILPIIPAQDRKDFLEYINSKDAKGAIELYKNNPPPANMAPGHEQLGLKSLEVIAPWASIYEVVRDAATHSPCSVASLFTEIWKEYCLVMEAEAPAEKPAEAPIGEPVLTPDAGTPAIEEPEVPVKVAAVGGGRMAPPPPMRR